MAHFCAIGACLGVITFGRSVKGGSSRRVSGRAPCHGKAGVLRAGGVAGSLRARAARASQDPKATAGMGPRRLPRAQARRMGRTPRRSPHDRRNLVAAARGQAARERGPNDPHKTTESATQVPAERGAQVQLRINNRAGSLRLRPCYGIM